MRVGSAAPRESLQRELSFSDKIESFSDGLEKIIDSRSRKSSFATAATEASSVRSNEVYGERSNLVSSIDASEASGVESWGELEAVLKQTAAMSVYCDPSRG